MPNKAETFARSETHINLMRAFAGESQARNRYTIAAGIAREKNLYVVQQVFLFTADQELTHAKQFYRPAGGPVRPDRPGGRYLSGGPVSRPALPPAGGPAQ